MFALARSTISIACPVLLASSEQKTKAGKLKSNDIDFFACSHVRQTIINHQTTDLTNAMSMPAPVSPPADMGSHSSSSSSSFVSWCESEHGSLPTTHQRILDTAKQHKCNDDAAPNPTTSTPPAAKVGLQTSVDVLQQFYESGRKGRRIGKVKTCTPPKATSQLNVVTDDEDNNGDSEEFEDEEYSYSSSSSDESVPEIVTIPASADREDEDLSSIFDMSLAEMFSDGEEGELEVEEDEKGRDEHDAADYGPGIKAVLKGGDRQRDVVFNETTVQKVTRFELPSSTSDNTKKKKKGVHVSFSDIGEGSGGKAKSYGDIPESEAGSNRMSGKSETGNKKKKRRSRSRYISSASSTRAVIQSFMSHTRASMAKTRRSLSKGNKSSTTKATGTKPAAGTKTTAKRDDKNAASDAAEQTDSNVADAVVRAKQRIRQHRHKQRASV